MAEFKLGRIRFVWKGDWSTSTVYYKDDIIRNGGNTYVCIKGHTSPALFTTNQELYWNKISDGIEWKANWLTSTYYKVNDIVKYGGYLYIANEAHTSSSSVTDGLEIDQAKWDLFAEGFDYKADWQANTRYKINDIAKYNGTVYICTQEHTSALTDALGLEADQSNWDIFSEGLFWKDDWAIGLRYRKNDVVRYGGQLYVCNTGHTSAATDADGLEADQAKWDYLHKGIEYLGNWASSTRYKINDVVKYGGGIWICIAYHTSQALFTDDEAKWAQFVEGLEFEDSWSPKVRYQPGDFVTYGGYSYVAITNNVEVKPYGNPNDWDLFTTGFRFLGDWGDDSSTQEYVVGDVVRVGGYTYLCTVDHTDERPPNINFWERLNQGINWEDDWTDGTYYDLGDAVSHGVNAYICVTPHTSDEIADQNRPDQDVTGTYWNILSGGPETGNLTTEGDLVYYGGAGPTRLPIGEPGQVLKVNDNGDAPTWDFFGAGKFIYYVESDAGVDQPAPLYGKTVDRPFKTVRYAAEQIEAGAEYFNAKNLLEKNRSFIQAETVEWVEYQIGVGTGIWSGFTQTADEKAKCRRDAGLILDAAIYDLSHGGNVKSREAALAYFDDLGVSVVAGEEDQTVAAWNYAIEVIDAVLSNLAPAANYQTLNSVADPITQVIDTTYTEEEDAQTQVESLIGIVTDAITQGNTNSVPAEVIANNTIFVKTGIFTEVLPIVVPRNTAVVGDELRSTKIQPAEQLVSSADTPYSLAVIGRLQAIIDGIVTDPGNVVKTTGNLLDPVDSRPVGSSGDATAAGTVSDLADEIIDILNNGIGNADALTFTDTGVAAKTTARTELQADRANILSDMDTWLQANTALDAGGITTCLRDVGYIVDGLSYDIQYGTNWATTINARAYYTGTVSNLPSGQVTDTVAALGQLKTIINSYMSGATEEAEAAGLIDEIIDVINNGIENLATITYPDYTWNAADETGAADALLARKTEMQTHAVSHVNVVNETLVFDTDLCYRDSGYIVDALAYDTALGTNFQSVFAGIRYYAGTASAQAVINDQLTQTVDAVKFIKQKAVHIALNGAGQRAVQLLQDINDYIDFYVNSNGTAPYKHGTMTRETSTDYTYAVETLEANRDFLVAEAIAYMADQYPAYSYDTDACSRDVNAYIDALKYDLIWTGNYKSTLAARYYANAVNGCLEEDMFYVRSATGIRNMTTQGLSGTLSTTSSYNTKRPSAGAYVSLDPGWGPDHEDAWISSKSPYVQNVTTFGTACVGCKIDGDLHAGGNDSIVANDFTQVLSDGIGVWCTNLGRTELVSVFSYYNHIGYLSENGGKIRATNGNNSYGDYGSVAEGVDDTEVPVTGFVDNQATDADIFSVLTDGNEILLIEYDHAGSHYTDATDGILTIENIGIADSNRVPGTYYNVSSSSTTGTGINDKYRIIVNSGGSCDVIVTAGGEGHAPADTITISDADIGGGGGADLTFDVATVGKTTIWTVTGEGFGAEVNNAVVKDGGVMEVRLLDIDDSANAFGGSDYITAQNVAQTGDNTEITISNTDVRLSSQYIGMAIYLTAGKGAGQYGIIDTYNSGTKIATVVKASDGSAGWDHVVSGTAIETELDDTTNYSIEPAISFAAPSSGLYADTAKGRAYVEDGKIIRITLWDPGTGYVTAPTLTITDPNNTNDVPFDVRIGDGVLAQPTWTNRGTGMATASAEVTGDGYADRYQPGNVINVKGLNDIPQEGSNIEFDSIPNTWFKLVVVRNVQGTGPYTATLQISPELTISDAPDHEDPITMRIRYSQVRLTGHDFLDIGTGNFGKTNYPGIPLVDPDPEKETNDLGGGRVFYTSTDQDGNFSVGGLFNVEQATGIATLNADAFNISGLQELQLGAVELGGTGAVITEFSTDGTFTANSDNIVPTQKAIKTYIQSQIGGGAGELNVNSITAGSVYITANEIDTTTGVQIDIRQKVTFEKGVDGHALAMNYYLQQ